jgi:hypothetical protein
MRNRAESRFLPKSAAQPLCAQRLQVKVEAELDANNLLSKVVPTTLLSAEPARLPQFNQDSNQTLPPDISSESCSHICLLLHPKARGV